MYSLERRDFYMLAMTSITLFGFISAQAMGSKDLFRCRQSCYQKFVQDWHHCMDFDGCKNCWNNCDQQLGPFPLSINSAVRQGSLVITDIAWDQAITNASQQCLVTWEVSGGGLMGNLLTDSSTVELSLWSDTVYHVQVTCKHKDTGGMRRSYKLIVDTQKLGEYGATGMQSIPLSTPFTKSLQYFYGNNDDNTLPNLGDSDETDSRMRILKDSSKDFLTPYNPNAIIKNKYSSLPSQEYPTTMPPVSTTTTLDKNEIVANNPEENKILMKSKVQSIKLIDQSNSAVTSIAEFFNATTLWLAIFGAILLFSSFIVLYLLVRPATKHVPVTICPIDHEVLMPNEVLPAVQLPPSISGFNGSEGTLCSGGCSGLPATTAAQTRRHHHKIAPLRSTLHV